MLRQDTLFEFDLTFDVLLSAAAIPALWDYIDSSFLVGNRKVLSHCTFWEGLNLRGERE